MKKILLNIALLLSVAMIYAQNETDALRYSQYFPSGTARYNGMGGSFGALGADPSAFIFNPAGLGIYKTSQLSFSPSFKINNNNSNYLGVKSRDFNANYFDINELSYVGAIECNNDYGLSYIVWGASYSQLNKFSENKYLSGINNSNSLSDWFAARATGTEYFNLADADAFYSSLAWENYLINPSDTITTSSFVSAYDNTYGEKQEQYISKRGSQGEYNFAIAANFMHKLYIGADFGIQSITYKQTITTQENRDVTEGVKSFSFVDKLYTTGSGINFKIGILYAPTDKIRIGAGFHTPTSVSLEDEYNTSIVTQLGDSSINYESPGGSFEYQLLSPLKANASFCYIPTPNFLFNVDYEYANYNAMKLRSDSYFFQNENQIIANSFRGGHNLKLGTEYRMGALNFRLGGAFYSSPYDTSSENYNYYTWLASAGIGIRTNHMFFDIAYSYMANSYIYYMYEGLVTSEPANIDYNRNQISFTIGFKW